MAHMIDTTTGKPAMAYVGDTPWHGLGQQLKRGAKIEEWQEASGMNWTILGTAAQYTSAITGKKTNFPDKRVLYRSDTDAPLAVVSDTFKIVQPGEVLEFFRDLTESAGFYLETAGCLFDGKRFWAMANTGMDGEVVPGDVIKSRLLLATSCDGTMKTVAQTISERVVCHNTLQIALGETDGARITTSHRTTFDPMSVKEKLGLITSGWANFMADMKAMAATPITNKQQVKQFLVNVFDGKMEAELEEQPNRFAMQKVWDLTLHSPGSDMAGKTVYGLMNGLTRFVDYERRATSQDNRLSNAWFGAGADLKEKGYTAAMQLVAEAA